MWDEYQPRSGLMWDTFLRNFLTFSVVTGLAWFEGHFHHQK
jgi:hypothetical protein